MNIFKDQKTTFLTFLHYNSPGVAHDYLGFVEEHPTVVEAHHGVLEEHSAVEEAQPGV